MKRIPALPLSIALLAATAGAVAQPALARQSERAELQSTHLISRSVTGGIPDGESSHAVISGDRRDARAIAFQSDATDLVQGDTNGVTDVFVVRRDGVFGNNGDQWFGGKNTLVSRPKRGGKANGPSWAPSIGGSYKNRPKCVAFLSSATNLVPFDTNGKVDAFVVQLNGHNVKRVSLPGNHQAQVDTTDVEVSGNCKRVAFVTGGTVYTRGAARTKRVGTGADPFWSTGLKHDLVYGGPKGIYISKQGVRGGRLLSHGGRNPAYNDIKRHVVAYEKTKNGRTQVYWRCLAGSRDCNHREHKASARKGQLGNGNSTNPVIGNSGYYITYQSEASNLGVNSLRRVGDYNRRPDAYLYTGVRDMTLVQSVMEKAVPVDGGGYNPSMSFYANYITFDTPSPVGAVDGPHQVYMRYLGPV
jgi:TolB protein